jgi:hypothetical protein
LFERTHSVDSAFNRIVIYSGNVLHAADIDGSLFNGNDNGRWRLTVSSLVRAKPAALQGSAGRSQAK